MFSMRALQQFPKNSYTFSTKDSKWIDSMRTIYIVRKYEPQ